MEITSTVKPVQDSRIPVSGARQAHIIAPAGQLPRHCGRDGGNRPAAGEAAGRSNFSEGNLLFALHRTHNCIRKVTLRGELFALHKSFEIGIDR
jgi:hypothetical protein